jgi:hypothetical protein
LEAESSIQKALGQILPKTLALVVVGMAASSQHTAHTPSIPSLWLAMMGLKRRKLLRKWCTCVGLWRASDIGLVARQEVPTLFGQQQLRQSEAGGWIALVFPGSLLS